MDALSRAWNSFRSAFTATNRVWSDPQQVIGLTVTNRTQFYDLMWDYYSNRAFQNWERYRQYRTDNGLYTYHRSIYNPFRRIVEFYVGQIYPGVLSEDGKDLPEGVPSAIPFTEDTDPKLLTAISQIFQWSNWQIGKDRMVRYAGSLGNCLVEVMDDVPGRKVYFKVWWPDKVRDLRLNNSGDTKYYSIEYRVNIVDASPEEAKAGGSEAFYVYRRDVDDKTITTYRNGKLFDYVTNVEDGPFAIVPHPYTFAPATWVKHFDMGEEFGQPIMWASLDKIDEANDLASMYHDQLANILSSPIGISKAGSSGAVLKSDTAEMQRQRQQQDKATGRDKARVLEFPQGTQFLNIPWQVGEVSVAIDKVLHELEQDHPELAMYPTLRANPGIAGVAARALVGDVEKLVWPAEAMYDQHTIKLCQMAVAIAGYRLRNGWEAAARAAGSPLDARHQKFANYGLDSYGAGDLAIAISKRPLFEPSEGDQWAVKEVKMRVLAAKVELGIPKEQVQSEMGDYTDKQLQTFAEDAAKQQEAMGAALLAFNSGAGANPTPPTSEMPMQNNPPQGATTSTGLA